MPDTYYGPNAYDSRQIPSLPRPLGPAPALSVLTRRLSTLLPWGNTQEVVPWSFMDDCSPEFIRTRAEFRKTHGNLDEYHFRFDHECYRHASFSFRTLLWGYMAGIGKILFFIAIPLLIFVYVVELTHTSKDASWQSITADFFWSFGVYVLGIPFISWLLGATALHFFSHWVDRPGKGPLWEMNRRTGMVTLFVYDKRGTYGRTGKPEEISAPFYEFDAYWVTGGDRQGPLHYLYFVHRYRNINVPIGDLISGRRNAVDCYAFWDMWQNYMDTSRPLPDIPLWEEYRDQDPVTAEHDRRTGRPPRYWRDMDDKTWEESLTDMNKKAANGVRSCLLPSKQQTGSGLAFCPQSCRPHQQTGSGLAFCPQSCRPHGLQTLFRVSAQTGSGLAFCTNGVRSCLLHKCTNGVRSCLLHKRGQVLPFALNLVDHVDFRHYPRHLKN